jgi:putative drug exporter of the RND superfamily
LRELASRLSARYAVLVIGLWLIAAGIGNLAAPQLERGRRKPCSFVHASRFRKFDRGRAVRRTFRRKPGNSFNYVVLEPDRPLTPQDR